MSQINVSSLSEKERFCLASLLLKAGYTVNIKKGWIVDGKDLTFLNYKTEEIEC